MPVYINAFEAISAQNTFDSNEFLNQFIPPENNYFSVLDPEYKQYINPRKLRRMSSVIRMGITCSTKVLENAEVKNPDAIIVGTGLGCLTDTIKFLDNMIEQQEVLLNPTAFIQSTHNTVSGQIALLLGCKSYNFTFSQQNASFETALLDAYIKLKDEDINNILVGGLDEINDRTFDLLEKSSCTKVDIQNIIDSNTSGYVPGEGASFFSLTSEESDKNIACIKSILLFEDDDEKALQQLLKENNLSIENIDALISGLNGDVSTDQNYRNIQNKLENSSHLAYKHLVGEYDTVSSFALSLASSIIEKQEIPHSTQLNATKKESIENILIHNYNKKHLHSFILISIKNNTKIRRQ
jgi:3-oxoacyl-(acyl-carrier-protein) synthase